MATGRITIGGYDYCTLNFEEVPEETCVGCCFWDKEKEQCMDATIWGKATEERQILLGPTPTEIRKWEREEKL